MAKKSKKIEGTVMRPFLHEGEHQSAGRDLLLDEGTARMLENSKKFTTTPEGRARAKEVAAAAERKQQNKDAGASAADIQLIEDADRAIQEAREAGDAQANRADEAILRAEKAEKAAAEANARAEKAEKAVEKAKKESGK